MHPTGYDVCFFALCFLTSLNDLNGALHISHFQPRPSPFSVRKTIRLMTCLAFPFNSGRYASMTLISLGNEHMWISVLCWFLYSRILPSRILSYKSIKVEQSVYHKLSEAGSLGSTYSEVIVAALTLHPKEGSKR